MSFNTSTIVGTAPRFTIQEHLPEIRKRNLRFLFYVNVSLDYWHAESPAVYISCMKVDELIMAISHLMVVELECLKLKS